MLLNKMKTMKPWWWLSFISFSPMNTVNTNSIVKLFEIKIKFLWWTSSQVLFKPSQLKKTLNMHLGASANRCRPITPYLIIKSYILCGVFIVFFFFSQHCYKLSLLRLFFCSLVFRNFKILLQYYIVIFYYHTRM